MKLQRIQFRAARLIKGLSPRDRVTPALIELHWLPIRARIIFKICTLAFQAMKYGKPQYMRNLLRSFSTHSNMTLRHEMDPFRLDHQRSKLQIGTRAFERSAPCLMNSLPNDIKDSSNLRIFKKTLKTFLFNECYDMTKKKISDHYKL